MIIFVFYWLISLVILTILLILAKKLWCNYKQRR